MADCAFAPNRYILLSRTGGFALPSWRHSRAFFATSRSPGELPRGAIGLLLSPGVKVGSYEVVSLLGQGGMGEVYRARDTKLGRNVALKILPEPFASDPERMARFEREAKVLASLNHPNIAAIYGFEDSGGVHALVMELVEGQTLARRIAGADRGATKAGMGFQRASVHAAAIPTEETLPVARQICEALEYAHERGIVHRDLKPANVKITPDGMVKLLDFGLAKALEGETVPADLSNSPTISQMATQAGIILGTAAYMSPEQARGKPVDRRADIWAFGCVLYEMLAGRKPFDGETVSDLLAAVIRSEPDWPAIPETTPASVQDLIHRCLQKDPRKRLQSIGDARITLEEAISSEVGTAPATTPGRTAPEQARALPKAAEGKQGPRPPRWLRAAPWVVAAISLTAATVLAALYFSRSSPAPTTIRAPVAPPQRASFAFSVPDGAPVLSPDGKRLVFPATDASGTESLWLRPLDSLTSERLQGTEGAQFPFWSPDSRYIAFFQSGKLMKMDASGGPPTLICNAPNGRGGAWSRNGVIVFAPRFVGGLSIVPSAGGTPTPIASAKVSGAISSDRWPVFLPDGRHFLYLGGDPAAEGTPKLGVYVGEIGSAEKRFLLQADSDALYAEPGYLLFLRGNTLMAQRFDAGNQELKGEAFPVAQDVGSPKQYGLGLFGVSQTGLLIYSPAEAGAAPGSGQLVWMDEKGKQTAKIGPAGVAIPQLSPNGKKVAYVVTNRERENIWVLDLPRGVQTRISFGRGPNVYAIWSPDGAHVAYTSLVHGKYDILMKAASGVGKAERLVEFRAAAYPTSWSSDGRYIALTREGSTGKGRFGVWMLPLSGSRKPFPYLQSPSFDVTDAVFSPDGRWIAFVSNESGQFEVYISPFPNSQGGRWQVSEAGGVQPQWNHDGSALYYLAPDGKLMGASIKQNGSSLEIGAPREIFEAPMVGVGAFGSAYSVAPEGNTFLVDESLHDVSRPLTLVTNWAAGFATP